MQHFFYEHKMKDLEVVKVNAICWESECLIPFYTDMGWILSPWRWWRNSEDKDDVEETEFC